MNRVNEIISRRNTLLLVALLACTSVWNAIWAINFFIATTWYNGVFTIYCNAHTQGGGSSYDNWVDLVLRYLGNINKFQ